MNYIQQSLERGCVVLDLLCISSTGRPRPCEYRAVFQAFETIGKLRCPPLQVPLNVRIACNRYKRQILIGRHAIDKVSDQDLVRTLLFSHRQNLIPVSPENCARMTLTYLEMNATSIEEYSSHLVRITTGAFAISKRFARNLHHADQRDIANLVATLIKLYVNDVFRKGKDNPDSFGHLCGLVDRTLRLFRKLPDNRGSVRSIIVEDITLRTMPMLNGIDRAYFYLMSLHWHPIYAMEELKLWDAFARDFTRLRSCQNKYLDGNLRRLKLFIALAFAAAPLNKSRQHVHQRMLSVFDAGNLKAFRAVESAVYSLRGAWPTVYDALADLNVISSELCSK